MKIIYFKKEVKIGDIIDFKGLSIIVTQELIDSNPEFFTIEEEKKEEIPKYVRCYNTKGLTDERWYTINKIYPVLLCKDDNTINIPDNISNHTWDLRGTTGVLENYFTFATKEDYDRQCLLEEANRKYPKGTKFKSIVTNKVRISDGIFSYSHKMEYISCEQGYIIYHNGVWSPRYLFTTEDGVDIYEYDYFWYITNSGEIKKNFMKLEALETFAKSPISFSLYVLILFIVYLYIIYSMKKLKILLESENILCIITTKEKW
jgi:hypothetical protein